MSGDLLRWGVLSTAKIGIEKVIPATLAAARCEVVAIASRDLGRAEAAASGLGIERALGSYEDLLADPDVEAVYNPLPNHLHTEWTIAAARAGKHVLCEKPLATNAAEAERMIRVCEAEGVLLMEAFMYRLHPTWEAVRELLASGRIGELKTVQSWFSYFNDDPNDIRNQLDAAGGALYDIGCYCVNLSRMLFAAEPIRVQGTVTRDPVTGVDTLTSGILDFDDGIASFTCSTRAEPDQRVHIYGTEGRISLEIPFNIPWDRPTRVLVTAGGDPPVRPETEVLTFDPANEYSIQAERFAAAALDGGSVPIPPSDAVDNLRVIEELFRAG
ncbi:MAG TPA: Gfo/Idh/MocA family oxidoreductase [Actinomycetota bacterium]|nr:Gfo/Idh/MocA family oxidoreductase [Actinomycetota bacterium]